MEGRGKDKGPLERFTGTLEGIGERSLDLSCVEEKSSAETNHPKKSLKSRFICRQRKLFNGGGMLGKRMETRTGEAMAQELGLQNCKLTFAQANR